MNPHFVTCVCMCVCVCVCLCIVFCAGEEILVWAHIPVCSDEMGMRPQSEVPDWIECCR